MESSPSRRRSGSSRGSRPACARPRGLSRSAYAPARACRLRRASAPACAAPGTPRSWSTKRSRGRRSAPAARPRGRRSSRRRSRCRRCRATPRGRAARAASGSSRRARSAPPAPGRSLLGVDDLHQLHLVELVLADHAARVLAGRARLGAEARRVAGELERQLLGRHDLVAHEVGDRVLGGRE